MNKTKTNDSIILACPLKTAAQGYGKFLGNRVLSVNCDEAER
jgi:hypothetical protein